MDIFEEDSGIPAPMPIEDDLILDENMTEEPDGSVLIELDQPEELLLKFDANLAEFVSEKKLKRLSSSLMESIEYDKEARKARDEQYEEGLRRTGLGNDAPGGAKFSGASKVVHPVMAEACIDFSARAIKELFPATGPVKMETTGVLPPEKEFQVKNLARCLNDQFRFRIPEYRAVQEQELTQLPLGGSQYMKFSVNLERQKIDVEFVPIDDILIPYSAASFYTAPRFAHRIYLTQEEYESRVNSGVYRDLDLINETTNPDLTAAEQANQKIEGKSASGLNEDGLRVAYEVYIELEFDEDELSQATRAPYIVTLDETTEEILSIYRNWDPNDQLRTRLDWITEDVFIPWRGAQGIGLPHLIGGLAGAATGALRALLDSAHINNAPTLLKLKGSRINGTTQSVAVTQIADIEGPVGIDDIRKYIMPMPFNAPSPVLFQLLGWLTDAAKGVVSTASEKIADATSNTPVGTVQALIEQGAVIFSSIHARLHFSQAKKFEIVLRILKTYFPNVLQEYGLAPEIVDARDIHPVSDPQIFSEAQRFAQAQGVLQLAKEAPEGMYNLKEAHRQLLMLMKIENVDRILPPDQQPQPVDVAAEMVAFVNGGPVIVTPEMDHRSHIATHVAYLKNPMGGMNPIMVPITAKILEHLRNHLGLYMAQRMIMAAQQAQQMQQGPQNMGAVGAGPQQGPQQQPQIPVDQIMAQVSMQAAQEDLELAQEARQIIEMTDEFVREMMMAQSPEMAMVKMQADAQKNALEAQIQKQQSDREVKLLQEDNRQARNEFELGLKERKLSHDEMIASLELKLTDLVEQRKVDTEVLMNRLDNQQKQMTELLKNQDDNRTKLIVEAVKASMMELGKIEPRAEPTDYIEHVEPLLTVKDPT